MAVGLAACSAATLPESNAQSRVRWRIHYGSSFALPASFCPGRFRAQRWYAGDNSIVLGQWTTDDHALGSYLVRPEFMGVVAAAHLDHCHHSPQLTFHLDIPLDDDLVGDEGHIFRRETRLRKGLGNFRGHEYGDARRGQRPD